LEVKELEEESDGKALVDGTPHAKSSTIFASLVFHFLSHDIEEGTT
jgi:hypothetical protein